jgi:hypothetical protein
VGGLVCTRKWLLQLQGGRLQLHMFVALTIISHAGEGGRSLHCKKGKPFSRPQPGCHLPNSPWPGIIKFFPVSLCLVHKLFKVFNYCFVHLLNMYYLAD